MTSTHDAPVDVGRRFLRDARGALDHAERALEHADPQQAREALAGLARGIAAAMSEVDRLVPARALRPARLRARLAWWQQQLDEARVQLALAELDMNDARHDLVEHVEKRFDTVSDLISRSLERVVISLRALHIEVQEAGHDSAPMDDLS